MPLRQKILLAVLALLVLYYLVTTFVMPPATAPVRPASPPPAQQNVSQAQSAAKQPVRQSNPQAAKMGGAANLLSVPDRNAFKEWGPRDPFYRQRVVIQSVSVTDSANKDLGLTLIGVQWSRGEALILINNEILRVNDSINGMRIVKAGEDYVVLQRGTDQITLRMGGKNE
jgi:hypothetical protein